MQITLDSNPSDAPCCIKIIADNGQDKLIQSDWDWPSIASTFGFSLTLVQRRNKECDHSGTDGTIRCPECGIQPGEFIQAAREWMDNNDGAQAEDPGYFDNA